MTGSALPERGAPPALPDGVTIDEGGRLEFHPALEVDDLPPHSRDHPCPRCLEVARRAALADGEGPEPDRG